jgi:hypothetical protein
MGFFVGLLLKLRWFSPNPPVSCTIGGTNKTYPKDIAEILLKLALNTIKQTNKILYLIYLFCIFQLFPVAGSFIGATNGAGNRRIRGKPPKLEQQTHKKTHG